MSIELLVDSAAFLSRVRRDLASASQSAYAQANTFEGDASGRAVADALLASPARDRRVIVDSYTRHIVSDRFRWSPASLADAAFRAEVRDTFALFAGLERDGVGVRFTNPVGPLFVRFPGRNHKKLVVVDEEVAYVGGLCFADHNFAWHDAMLRIEDPRAASFLHTDFLSTWDGHHRGATAHLPGLTIHALDGASNEAAFAEVLDLIDTAQTEIFVEVPYLTSPFIEHLRAAGRRGVHVVAVTPFANNWALPGALMRREASRAGFEVRRYERMTHMKAALIDRRVLVMGSANMDTFSYRTQQEYLCIATDPALVADFVARVVRPDMARSTPLDSQIGVFEDTATTVIAAGVDRFACLWKRLATTRRDWEEHTWEGAVASAPPAPALATPIAVRG